MLVLVAAWLAALSLVWLRLIRRHPEKYDAMGRPHFLTLRGSIATLRFVLVREHRTMHDRTLGILSDSALAIFSLYVLGFIFLALST